MNELTRQGIAALKAGDREAARRQLLAAVTQDPDDAAAWLWLSGAVETGEERAGCLYQVLRIDPGNAAAQKGLEKLQGLKASPKQTAPASPQSQPGNHPTEPKADLLVPGASEFDQEELDERLTQAAAPSPELEKTPVTVSVQPAARPTNSALIQENIRPTRPQRAGEANWDDQAEPGERVFRARPSAVLPLIGFWVMVIGVWAMNQLLQEEPMVHLTLSLMTCGLLGLVVLYILIRLMTTRYELTTRSLSVPFRGKQVLILVRQIFDASYHQSPVQKLLNIGDVQVEAAIHDELCRVKLRNLPQVKHRTEQILYFTRDTK